MPVLRHGRHRFTLILHQTSCIITPFLRLNPSSRLSWPLNRINSQSRFTQNTVNTGQNCAFVDSMVNLKETMWTFTTERGIFKHGIFVITNDYVKQGAPHIWIFFHSLSNKDDCGVIMFWTWPPRNELTEMKHVFPLFWPYTVQKW